MDNYKVNYKLGSFDTMQVTDTDDKGKATAVEIRGEQFVPTRRFWNSMTSNYGSLGLSEKLFNLFSHEEVFDRLSARCNEGFGYTTYEHEGQNFLLGARKPSKAYADHDGVMKMLQDVDAKDVEFNEHNGTLTAWHNPNHIGKFEIGGDEMIPKFVSEIPIDGFGKPSMFLSMIRTVCTNGLIGYGKAFRSEVNLGRGDAGVEVIHSIRRTINSYNNEEGFEALQNRLEEATNSWASVREVAQLRKLLSNTAMIEPTSPKVPGRFDIEVPSTFENAPAYKANRAYTDLVGDIQLLYGLASDEALGEKRLATMPSKCTMYELMNFATEVSTHFVEDKTASRKLQACVGKFLSSEYDLEGTVEAYPTFRDWHIGDSNLREGREELAV
jgi:hypothetical protein